MHVSVGFTPARTPGTTKYGNSGGMSLALASRNIPLEVKQDLIRFGNNGVTQNTWSTYRTAQKLLALCCKEHNMVLTLPVPEDTILVFIR